MIYAEEHAVNVKDPARIGYAIEALLPFWGDLPLSAITRETCKAYGKSRLKVTRRHPETGQPVQTEPVAQGTVRKELVVLSAAINYCVGEGRIVNPPKVHLPPKPPSKERYLTRDEAAALLRATRSDPKSRHLAKFILVGLYTGTRKTAILRLRFMPNAAGGWIDTERGVLYRRGVGEYDTKKRRPPITLPRQLLAHARRWEAAGSRWVVDYNGNGVGSIKTAWNTAIRKAGLSDEDITPHTLRHTAVTWAMQAGADIWETAGFFGVSIETMMRTYAHHHPDHQSTAVRAMESRGRKL